MVNTNEKKKLFIKLFDEKMKKNDFTKQGLSWKKQIKDYWILLNLQKSQYGDYFYLNFGLSTSKLIKMQPVYRWLLSTRYETIFELSNNGLLELFSYDIETRKIGRNIKIVIRNVNEIISLLEKFDNANYINKNIVELRKLFNLSCFDLIDLTKLIKKRRSKKAKR